MRGGQLVSPLTPRLSAVAAVIFMVVCIHQVSLIPRDAEKSRKRRMQSRGLPSVFSTASSLWSPQLPSQLYPVYISTGRRMLDRRRESQIQSPDARTRSQVPSTCHSALQEMWEDAHPKDKLAQVGAAAAAAAPLTKTSVGDAAGGVLPGSAGAIRAADGTRPPLFETLPSPSPSPSPRTSPSPPPRRRSGAGEGEGTAGWGNNGSASVSKLGQGDKAAAKDVGVNVCVECDMPGGSPHVASGKAGLTESW